MQTPCSGSPPVSLLRSLWLRIPQQSGQVSDSPAQSSPHAPATSSRPAWASSSHPTSPHPSIHPKSPACLPREDSNSPLLQGARPDLQMGVGTLPPAPALPSHLRRCECAPPTRGWDFLPPSRSPASLDSVLRAGHGGRAGEAVPGRGADGLENRGPKPETRLPDTKLCGQAGGWGVAAREPVQGLARADLTAPLSSSRR